MDACKRAAAEAGKDLGTLREVLGAPEVQVSPSFRNAIKAAFLAGWWVNAATPGEDGSGPREYFQGCAEVDWQEFAARNGF